MLVPVAALLSASLAWGQHGFEELIQRTPAGANAMVLINVEKTLESPVAKARDWKTKLSEAFESGMVTLPPHATRFVQASQIDFETMHPMWEATVVELQDTPDFDNIVKSHEGTRDQVGSHPAAAFRDDSYLVQFGPKLLGQMQPANRQQVGRWVKRSDADKGGSLSPYLEEAANYVEFRGTEMILAIDLAYVVSEEFAERSLSDSEVVKEGKGDVKALAEVVSGLRGVMLGIVFRDKPHAKIKVDFNTSTAPLGKLAKPLLLAAIKNRGVMIDDFEDWKVSLKDKHVYLEGDMSPAGMRQLMTLVVGPSSHVDEVATAKPDKAPPTSESLEKLKADATEKYLNRVGTLVSDIATRKNAKTIAQYGVWLTQYARKIESLSTSGVDDEVSRFGLHAAGQLRQAGTAVRGIGIQSSARESQVYSEPTVAGYSRSGVGMSGYYGYGSTYGSEYGYYYHDRNVSAERRAIRKQEQAKGITSAYEIIGQLESDLAELRRRQAEGGKDEG
ncbi:MAG: hypothetical protein AB7O62_04440 [Pirellulales bacterium]